MYKQWLLCYKIQPTNGRGEFSWQNGLKARLLYLKYASLKFSHFYILFQTNTLEKDMSSLIFLAMGYIAPILSFYKDGIKVDMLLNKKNNLI